MDITKAVVELFIITCSNGAGESSIGVSTVNRTNLQIMHKLV